MFDAIMILAYFIMTSINEEMKFLALTIALSCVVVPLVIISIFFLAPRTYLSMFSVSNGGIRWYINKKTIAELKWEDMLDVKIEVRLYRKCMVFDIAKHISGFRKNEFYFNVDKENIQTVYKFCKNENINLKIENFIKNKEYKTPIFIWKK